MDQRTEILIRRTCPDCNGDRLVQNPVWERFFREKGPNASLDEAKEWFWDNGYIGDPEQYPEEVPCSTCNGTGMKEEWVSIDALLDTFIQAVGTNWLFILEKMLPPEQKTHNQP